LANPDLASLAGMSPEAFERRFEGTPVRRAKWAGLVRNARIAVANLMRRSDLE
jgi:epoxyqueuosine reductase QueG